MTIEEQIQTGAKASQAYNSYLKGVISLERNSIKERIFEIDNANDMLELVKLAKCWQAIENRILSDIETGRLAELTLNKEK